MRYYKIENDKHILAVGIGSGGKEITESDYKNILSIIQEKPEAMDRYCLRLTKEMTWEQYEVPVETDPELTEAEALDIILGGEA